MPTAASATQSYLDTLVIWDEIVPPQSAIFTSLIGPSCYLISGARGRRGPQE